MARRIPLFFLNHSGWPLESGSIFLPVQDASWPWLAHAAECGGKEYSTFPGSPTQGINTNMGDCREITAWCAQRLHRLDGRPRRGVLPVARRADRDVDLLGLSGVVAIVAGVALNRPARTAPWLLLAAAQLSFVAGQT